MQELKLIVAESDASSLVLRVTEPQDSTSGEEFFLPVTDDLRRVLDGTSSPSSTASAGSASASSTTGTATSSEAETGSQADLSSTDATSAPSPLSNALGSLTATPDSTDQPANDKSDLSTANADDSASGAESYDTPADGEDADQEGVEEGKVAGFGKFGRTSQRPHRTKISITPRAIQDRVRHGASIEELAEEADTDPSRVEPYAWPILQERARMADLAHSAHPVSSDGPAKNTLWEVLATSLAARGESLSECEWDAYLNEAKQWIVTVSWNKSAAGQVATHVAEFLLQQQQPGPSLAQPINSIAGDLVDPRYGQAPRRVAAVTPLRWHDETDGPDDRMGGYDEAAYGAEDYERREQSRADYDPADDRGSARSRAQSGGRDGADGDEADEDFLLHPEEDDRPKRRRKAITPHWEDVLLGVRTNPRKKR
ncbi:septation protein SepH [uncultured Corynebacterium sp.]|uniref:septation protein SepH n=1 Tax=uncultured Corynebacterium sp. TaxID=159447 RepID=UPI0025DF02F8|nr:septation protein SepH [uncultured Corynebacterium sp.]